MVTGKRIDSLPGRTRFGRAASPWLSISGAMGEPGDSWTGGDLDKKGMVQGSWEYITALYLVGESNSQQKAGLADWYVTA